MNVLPQVSLLSDGSAQPLATSPGVAPSSVLTVQGNASGTPLPSTDQYSSGQTLADQAGAAGVLTFTFSTPQHLVWIMSQGGTARADPFGGTPSASQGIPCLDGAATPLTVTTSTVKVYAPTGATVSAWGFRY